MFRDLFYGANTLLGYDRLAADLRIEARLDEIEKAIAKQARERSNPEPAPRQYLASAPAVDLQDVVQVPNSRNVAEAPDLCNVEQGASVDGLTLQSNPTAIAPTAPASTKWRMKL